LFFFSFLPGFLFVIIIFCFLVFNSNYCCWPQASKQIIDKNNVVLIEQSTQTDEELIYNYAWERYYTYFYTHHQKQHENTNANQTAVVNIDESAQGAASCSNSEPLNFDSIKKCAEESLEKKGLVYDEKIGYYYDKNTGYHYDQVLFFVNIILIPIDLFLLKTRKISFILTTKVGFTINLMKMKKN
jgi:hypothetical protein